MKCFSATFHNSNQDQVGAKAAAHLQLVMNANCKLVAPPSIRLIDSDRVLKLATQAFEWSAMLFQR